MPFTGAAMSQGSARVCTPRPVISFITLIASRYFMSAEGNLVESLGNRKFCVGVATLLAAAVVAGCNSAAAEKEAADQLKALGAIVSPSADGFPNSLILGGIGKDISLDEALPLAGELFHLKSLKLSSSPVTDDQLVHVGGLKNLNDLQLDQTGITDAGISHLTGLSKLESLMLTETNITSACVSDLAKLSSLKVLQLDRTNVSGLQPLQGLTNLTLLVLSGVTISDEDAEAISGIPNIKRIDVAEATISAEALAKLKSAVPGITE